MEYGLTHAAIVDFDLHHGDGSQAIAWTRNKKVQNLPKGTANRKKTSIGYFSLHDINSFPCEWGEDDKVQAASLCIENAHGQTVWNVHLQPWSTPEEFWNLYEDRYLVLLEKARKYLKSHTSRLLASPTHPAPKAAIFLSAGFDASEWETPGMQRHGTNVPTEFYARFTRDVVRLAEEEGTAVEGRIISVLEGGYSDRALTSGVLSHLSGLTHGQVMSNPSASSRLAANMIQRFGGLGLQEETTAMQTPPSEPAIIPYDPQWWHENQLNDLENMVTPPPVPKAKKYKTGPPPTYSSPTQSFTAKLTDPTRYQRSVSGNYVPIPPPREPTPPPPDVDWVTASHALSKLLIPFDRQTESCKPAELAEPKMKKEKPPPVLTSVHVDPSGRQLRGRKPVTSYRDGASDDENSRARAESKVNRRRTMAALPTAAEEPAPARSASRRVSIASSMGSVNGDAETVRASSVASRRRSVTPALSVAGNGEVAVKKARGTAASRIPKNRPPVPRVPSGFATKPPVIKEKENDMDALTSGLKRITLKLPSKEEYETRERQKALGVETTSTAKSGTRKPAVGRPKAIKSSSASKVATTTTKKGPGRPSKTSKPASPVEAPVTILPEPEIMPAELEAAASAVAEAPAEPKIEAAMSPPLEQPEPVQPEQTATLFRTETKSDRSASSETIVEPPTELREMVFSPDQLPKPSCVTSVGPFPVTVSPSRPDTPPPPAPSIIPEFVQYTAQAFGTGSHVEQAATAPCPQQPLQWVAFSKEGPSMSPATRREQLPVFGANSVIPFASGTKMASSTGTVESTTSKSNIGNGDIWAVPDTPGRS
jgi:histone deacetylase HOS3